MVFPAAPLLEMDNPEEYDPPASQTVSPAATLDQLMLDPDQALFQSDPLFAPVEPGRTYQLAAKRVNGRKSKAISRGFISLLVLADLQISAFFKTE